MEERQETKRIRVLRMDIRYEQDRWEGRQRMLPAKYSRDGQFLHDGDVHLGNQATEQDWPLSRPPLPKGKTEIWGERNAKEHVVSPRFLRSKTEYLDIHVQDERLMRPSEQKTRERLKAVQNAIMFNAVVIGAGGRGRIPLQVERSGPQGSGLLRWESPKHQPFPHEVRLEFGASFIKEIRIWVDHFKTPTSMLVVAGMPDGTVRKLGRVAFANGQANSFSACEIKFISIGLECNFLHLVFEGCYSNEWNQNAQIQVNGLILVGKQYTNFDNENNSQQERQQYQQHRPEHSSFNLADQYATRRESTQIAPHSERSQAGKRSNSGRRRKRSARQEMTTESLLKKVEKIVFFVKEQGDVNGMTSQDQQQVLHTDQRVKNLIHAKDLAVAQEDFARAAELKRELHKVAERAVAFFNRVFETDLADEELSTSRSSSRSSVRSAVSSRRSNRAAQAAANSIVNGSIANAPFQVNDNSGQVLMVPRNKLRPAAKLPLTLTSPLSIGSQSLPHEQKEEPQQDEDNGMQEEDGVNTLEEVDGPSEAPVQQQRTGGGEVHPIKGWEKLMQGDVMMPRPMSQTDRSVMTDRSEFSVTSSTSLRLVPEAGPISNVPSFPIIMSDYVFEEIKEADANENLVDIESPAPMIDSPHQIDQEQHENAVVDHREEQQHDCDESVENEPIKESEDEERLLAFAEGGRRVRDVDTMDAKLRAFVGEPIETEEAATSPQSAKADMQDTETNVRRVASAPGNISHEAMGLSPLGVHSPQQEQNHGSQIQDESLISPSSEKSHIPSSSPVVPAALESESQKQDQVERASAVSEVDSLSSPADLDTGRSLSSEDIKAREEDLLIMLQNAQATFLENENPWAMVNQFSLLDLTAKGLVARDQACREAAAELSQMVSSHLHMDEYAQWSEEECYDVFRMIRLLSRKIRKGDMGDQTNQQILNSFSLLMGQGEEHAAAVVQVLTKTPFNENCNEEEVAVRRLKILEHFAQALHRTGTVDIAPFVDCMKNFVESVIWDGSPLSVRHAANILLDNL